MSINLNSGIPGSVLGTAIAANYVGEKFGDSSWSSTLGTKTSAGSTYLNIAELTNLTPGVWLIYGSVYIGSNGANLETINLTISTANNSASGVAINQTVFGTGAACSVFQPTVMRYVNISSNTNYFLNAAASTSGSTNSWGWDASGNNSGEGYFYAVRIA